MKKSILKLSVLLSLIFFFGLSLANAQENKENNIVEIKIMTSAQCGMCKERIEKAVNDLSGIQYANLDVESKVLEVKYDSEVTSPETIRKAVSKVGYDADDVPADKKAYKKLPKCCQKGGHSK